MGVSKLSSSSWRSLPGGVSGGRRGRSAGASPALESMTYKERQRTRVVDCVDTRRNPCCESKRVEEERRLQAFNRNPLLHAPTSADVTRSETFSKKKRSAAEEALEARCRVLAETCGENPSMIPSLAPVATAGHQQSILSLHLDSALRHESDGRSGKKETQRNKDTERALCLYMKGAALEAAPTSFGHRPSSGQRVFNPSTMSTNVVSLFRSPSGTYPVLALDAKKRQRRRRIGLSSDALRELLAGDGGAESSISARGVDTGTGGPFKNHEASTALGREKRNLIAGNDSSGGSAVLYGKEIEDEVRQILGESKQPWNSSFGMLTAATEKESRELRMREAAIAFSNTDIVPDRGEKYVIQKMMYQKEAAGLKPLEREQDDTGVQVRHLRRQTAQRKVAPPPQSPRSIVARMETARLKKERKYRDRLNERRVRRDQLLQQYKKIPPVEQQYADLLQQAKTLVGGAR